MKKNKKLPNKLSELLFLAVEDAKKIQKLKGYKLEMGTWHNNQVWDEDAGKSTKTETCNVCLAGSVMACTLKLNKNEAHEPYEFDGVTEEKLLAVDRLRAGDWSFEPEEEQEDEDCWDPNRLVDPRDWKLANKAMNVIADAFDKNLDGGRAPWKVYLKAAKMLKEAGY